MLINIIVINYCNKLLFAKMKRIALIVFFGLLFGSFASGACPVLSGYVDKVYSSTGENIIEFDVESDEQDQPIFIYVDESRVDEFKIFNLSEKRDGKYFKHIKFDITKTFINTYLSTPGYHSLLITSDGTYGMEDITGLCENPVCNRTRHPCNATGNIMKSVKTISDIEQYGISYKLRFENKSINISYTETPMNISLPDSFMFQLSNKTEINKTEIKELRNYVVISGIVYDKDANPASNITVGFYLHGAEGTFRHIFTKTGDDGKFIIYYEPKGKMVQVINLLIMTNESIQTYNTWDFKIKYAVLETKKEIPKKENTAVFPLVPTFIISIVVGAFLTMVLVGKIKLGKIKLGKKAI